MTYAYVDAHCHVDAYSSLLPVVQKATEAEVVIIAMTELPSRQQQLTTIVGNRPALRVALGIHPIMAARVTPLERRLFVKQLRTTHYVGEVGLDYAVDSSQRSVQREMFDFVLTKAARDKILSIHSRRAAEDVVAAVAESGAVAPILHWYSGPLRLVDYALEAGCYFSFNSTMTRSAKGRALLQRLPRDRVLTETDGPYTRCGNRTAEPADVPSIVDDLSRLWDSDHVATRQTVWDNMAALAARVSAVKQHCPTSE